jgi:serine O-acetyltransferase
MRACLGDQRPGSRNRTPAAGRCARSAGRCDPAGGHLRPDLCQRAGRWPADGDFAGLHGSAFADDLQQLLHCGKSFRVYSNPDFIGVQLGGAVKNVIAIGAGMSDGIGFGANARTALITRGLTEMSRLGEALGADPATFMGMAGLGDLVLTCTDNQSRNRRFGMMLGQGMDVQSAQEKIGQVVEGYRNTKEVRVLAHRLGVEMPITEEIYQVLYCGKIAREAALTLLGRARKDERSSNSRNLCHLNDPASAELAGHYYRLEYAMPCEELDIVWNNIKAEARALADCEPMLASFYHATLLKHENLGSALSYMLANKLASSIMPAIAIREVVEEAYAADPEMIASAACDIQAVRTRDPAVDKYSTPLLYLKGFHALQAYRIGHWLWNEGRRALAIFLQNQVSVTFQVDIHPAAKIGRGIMLDHATGIVVGETAVIEDDVSILQSVTLGGTGKTSGDRHPKIREGVMIGAGAKILGNIEVGRGAKIGAGSVVLQPVPPHTTAAGVPARIVGKPDSDKPSMDMDQHFNGIHHTFEYGDGI